MCHQLLFKKKLCLLKIPTMKGYYINQPLNLVTFSPISVTRPSSSCPDTNGKLQGPQSFDPVWTSEWQIPQN